ncbi:hypothetical protein [Actinophytocola sp.]|uniref:hypothetical protein n=1 Tax=Actinophytocola sp. TaxID=1872138 RepID=UPI002ED387EB
MSSARWWAAAACLFAVAVTALVCVLALFDGLPTADAVASVVGAAAGVGSFLLAGVAVVVSLRQAGGPEDARVAQALNYLARVVHRQWTDEAAIRHVLDPDPIKVEWELTARPVSASMSVVFRRAERVSPRGGARELTTLFRRLPRHQLVLLGEPGAGKSALTILLAVGLTENREADRRALVPAIIPIGGWDPDREHLDAFVVAALTREYPFLRADAGHGATIAERLLLDGAVVPVLDGLDEIPPALQAAAFAAVNRAFAGDRPMVLTCRGEEYQRAVEETGQLLPAAAVVEIAPLRVPEIIKYLSAGSVQTTDRWQPVFTHLRKRPRGPLAEALSTPLFVTLARTVFVEPTSEPSTLLAYTDRRAAEDWLLDQFLPAAYRKHPAIRLSGVTTKGIRARHYPLSRARTWLRFLAVHMSAAHTRDLVWWNLASTLPARGVGIAMAALITLPLLGLATVFLPLQYALIAWLPVAVVVGVSAGASVNAGAPQTLTWRLDRSRLRDARPELLLVVIFSVGLFSANGYPGAGIAAAVAGVLLLVVPGCLVASSDTRRAVLPSRVLRQDRLAMIGMTVAVTLLGGAGLALVLTLAGASTKTALGGVLIGLVVGLIFASGGSYGIFLVVRTWLALRRDLPWRLQRFLDDAHQREILRRVGVLWQFRHARLQDRLAGMEFNPGEAQETILVSPSEAEQPAAVRMPPMRERIKWALGALAIGIGIIGVLLWRGWATRNALLTGGTAALALAVMAFYSHDPPEQESVEPDDPAPPEQRANF